MANQVPVSGGATSSPFYGESSESWIDEQVTIAHGSSSAKLTQTLPARSKVLYAQLANVTTVKFQGTQDSTNTCLAWGLHMSTNTTPSTTSVGGNGAVGMYGSVALVAYATVTSTVATNSATVVFAGAPIGAPLNSDWQNTSTANLFVVGTPGALTSISTASVWMAANGTNNYSFGTSTATSTTTYTVNVRLLVRTFAAIPTT